MMLGCLLPSPGALAWLVCLAEGVPFSDSYKFTCDTESAGQIHWSQSLFRIHTKVPFPCYEV